MGSAPLLPLPSPPAFIPPGRSPNPTRSPTGTVLSHREMLRITRLGSRFRLAGDGPTPDAISSMSLSSAAYHEVLSGALRS